MDAGNESETRQKTGGHAAERHWKELPRHKQSLSSDTESYKERFALLMIFGFISAACPVTGIRRLLTISIAMAKERRRLDVVCTMQVAPGTKAKTKRVLGLLFQRAMPDGWATTNPIRLVRQSGMPFQEETPLTPIEVAALLSELREPFDTLILPVSVTGSHRGELFGLNEARRLRTGRDAVVRCVMDPLFVERGQPIRSVIDRKGDWTLCVPGRLPWFLLKV
jgi:hypothetical protein